MTTRERRHAARRARLRAVAASLCVAAITVFIGCLPAQTRRTVAPTPASVAAVSPASTPAPIASGPSPTPSFVPPTPTPAPTFLVVTVRQGESLNTIAHRFGTTARSIAFWNRSTYPSLDPESATYKPGLLMVGWTLYLVPNLVVDEETGEAVDPPESPAEP